MTHPLDIPKFLRVTPKEAARRRLAWERNPPKPMPVFGLDQNEREERERARAEQRAAEAAARAERRKARDEVKKSDEALIARIQRHHDTMSDATYKRILKTAPSKEHRNYFKSRCEQRGSRWEFIPEIKHGVLTGQVVQSKSAPKSIEPDDIARRLDLLLKGCHVDSVRPEEYRIRLQQLAQLNGCWKDDYLRLDRGRLRMTVSNALRGKQRRGEAIKWTKWEA
jgi:hypothetical protein